LARALSKDRAIPLTAKGHTDTIATSVASAHLDRSPTRIDNAGPSYPHPLRLAQRSAFTASRTVIVTPAGVFATATALVTLFVSGITVAVYAKPVRTNSQLDLCEACCRESVDAQDHCAGQQRFAHLLEKHPSTPAEDVPPNHPGTSSVPTRREEACLKGTVEAPSG